MHGNCSGAACYIVQADALLLGQEGLAQRFAGYRLLRVGPRREQPCRPVGTELASCWARIAPIAWADKGIWSSARIFGLVNRRHGQPALSDSSGSNGSAQASRPGEIVDTWGPRSFKRP